MSAYRPYPKYKYSGVEWLGDVPEGWEVKRFKGMLKEREERSKDGAETLLSVSAYTGVTPRSEVVDDGDYLSRAESLEGYKVCHPDDLVMNIMLAWNRGLAFTRHHGIVSPAYCVFHLTGTDSPRFLNYLVRSDEYTLYFKAFSTGVIDSRLRIYPETFGALFCGLPPLPEQIQIAAFLDRECGKLDALQAKQERLIELLKEKRQALISHAVTQGLPGVASAKTGLDPTAKLKPSGIEWLGDVPEHWQTGRIKTVSRFTTSGPRGWSERVGETGALFVQSGDLNDRLEIEFASTRRVDVEGNAETSRTRLRDGDVVVCITGAKTGNVAVCDKVPEEAYINQHLCLIRPNRKVASRFVGTVLKSHLGRSYFDVSQYGLKQGLSLEDVLEAPMPLPPLAEQRAIVAHLDDKCGKIDRLMAKAERAIALLKERRSALISAAVTGKIDVRNA